MSDRGDQRGRLAGLASAEQRDGSLDTTRLRGGCRLGGEPASSVGKQHEPIGDWVTDVQRCEILRGRERWLRRNSKSAAAVHGFGTGPCPFHTDEDGECDSDRQDTHD